VFQRFSAARTPTPEQLAAMGLSALTPLAQLMVRQMLFLDPPDHTRIRGLASKAFTPRRVEALRSHIQEITDSLLDAVQPRGRMDVIADLAYPLPAILTAEQDGDRLTEEEIIANVIVTMVGGQETTTNLIGNGVLTLLRHRDHLARLRAALADRGAIAVAVEELLRYESPSQHTARLAP